VIYLDVEDLLHVAKRTIGDVEVRDLGLLEAAAARPRASAFGEDAYASVLEKAAALIHSTARNHALVDGDKRLALAGGLALLGVNGLRLTMSNDEAYGLIISIATGDLDGVRGIADVLGLHTERRRR
jgi:death-on-curing protein